MRPALVIAPGKEKAILRRHPWIFSGAVRRVVGQPQEGDLVDVLAPDGTWLAVGHYQPDSIICKVLSFDTQQIDGAFFRRRLQSAVDYRRRLGFRFAPSINSQLSTLNSQFSTLHSPLSTLHSPLSTLHSQLSTNVFRLVHAEGDLMPGLVADWYNGVLVLQAHSVGMHRLFPTFADIFHDLLGDSLLAVFDKSSATLPKPPADYSDGFIYQNSQFSILNSQFLTDWEVCENGNRFVINFYEGQKTGFFVDQRENRALLQSLAYGHRVLNCFGYTGGFSLAALRGGAEFVETVDISKKAIDLCNSNVALNFGPDAPHRGTVADVLRYLSGQLPVASDQKAVVPPTTDHWPLTTDHFPLSTLLPALKGTACDAAQPVRGCRANSPLSTPYDFIILDPPAFAKNHRSLQQGLKGYRRINQAAMEMLPEGGLLMTFSCSQAVSVDDFRTMVFTSAMNAHREVRIVRQLPHAADHPVSVYHPEGEYLKGLLLEVR